MCSKTMMALVGLLVVGCSHAGERSASVTPSARPSHVTLTHLGVAGWKLESAAGTMLVDPYVTRAKVEDHLPLLPNSAVIATFIPAAVDAVVVSHSHYDHVLDVPSIAKRTGATVIGTESTANLLRASGVSDSQMRIARGGESFEIGPFVVRSVPALHSLTGQANVPIPSNVTLPLRPNGYGEGGTLQYLVRFEGRSIYFVGTANFVEEELKALSPRIDVAVVAVGLRSKVPDYTCRLLRALGHPKRVLPNHFDEFQEPLRPGEMEPTPETRADLEAFAAEVKACSPETTTEIPVHLQPIAL